MVKRHEKGEVTVLQVKKYLKQALDHLKFGDESYSTVLKRLIETRSYDIINGKIVWFSQGHEQWLDSCTPHQFKDRVGDYIQRLEVEEQR